MVVCVSVCVWLSMIDDCVRVSSSYAGDFCVSRLAEVQQLILFAAGTGFTPMAALITHCYAEANSATRFVFTYLVQNEYWHRRRTPV